MIRQTTEKLKQKRKLLLVLPLIIGVFGTFTCWALGLGTGVEQKTEQQSGINTELPQARLEQRPEDKLSLYNQAQKDSLAKHQSSGLDPFASSDSLLPGHGDGAAMASSNESYSAAGSPGSNTLYADRNEQKVRDRLARLEEALGAEQPDYSPGGQVSATSDPSTASDMDKLEQMMERINSSGESDAEVQGLNELMEKVLDVQYPERARQKLLEKSRENKGRAYSVTPKRDKAEIKLMPPLTTKDRARLVDSGEVLVYEPLGDQGAFYKLRGTTVPDEQTALPAVIHETQTLLSGSTVKLRLSEDIVINGKLIPSGTFVFGTCAINGERLQIEVPAIRYGKHLLPVALKVFDLDGLDGIRVPGALGRDAAKDGAGQMVSGMQLMSLDPSLYAQAASTGVEVAKGLLSKKAKLIRVTVKAGYPVLLMDEKSLQDLK